ncbi:MAG: sigma-70 family RNA polymerase sigma factor, partial [Planctomycetota bacterium]|nr:sigma-70 family RNA polymerase sigma factor [Planctomycetota bacterium]
EDSVQETFLRFLRSTPECGSSGSLGPWFFQVCRNLCLDAMKKETREDGRVEKAVEPNLPLTPVEVAEGAELRALVSDEMDRLPEKEREVLQLKIHEGLKYKEIAEVVGVAPGTVGWLVHQALGRLSSRLSSVASSG